MALNDYAYYNTANGLIENVIYIEDEIAPTLVFPDGYAIVDIPDGGVAGQWSMCGIGWSYINGQFVEPSYNPSAVSKLTSLIDATATEIQVESTAFFAPTGALSVDKELMSYSAISGNTFTGLVRGINGTTATEHLSGALAAFVGNV